MRVTLAKLAANRRNAKKSTGPKSPEGKARSCLNAVKHGLFAATPILAVSGHSEQEAERNRLVSALAKELLPETALERYLVTRIVNLAWQLLRVERVATHPVKNPPKAFNHCLLEYTRRLMKRTERMYFLFQHVKRTQISNQRLIQSGEAPRPAAQPRGEAPGSSHLAGVKRTQTSQVIQAIEKELSASGGQCKSNPKLERVI